MFSLNLEILWARQGFFLSLLAENVPSWAESKGNWQARQEMLQKVRTLLLLHLLLAQITNREVGAPLEMTNCLSSEKRGLLLLTVKDWHRILFANIYFQKPSPEMEVTEIILAKVSRLCQLSSHSRGFLSRL